MIPSWRWCRILWRCHAGGLPLLKAMAGTPIMPTSPGRRVTIGESPHRTYTGCNYIGYLTHSLTRHTAAYLGLKRARFALCAPSAVEGTQEPALKSSTAACTCRLSCQFKSSCMRVECQCLLARHWHNWTHCLVVAQFTPRPYDPVSPVQWRAPEPALRLPHTL